MDLLILHLTQCQCGAYIHVVQDLVVHVENVRIPLSRRDSNHIQVTQPQRGGKDFLEFGLGGLFELLEAITCEVESSARI